MNENLKWYLEAIQHEVEQLNPRFSGKIDFQLNLKEGSVGNMNVTLGKSIKKIEQK